ncbi:MAG: hypothetical protein E7515_05505 [Ruminococcaceae bacterium]|nr:hypothetical protein [Oscillospiraceae bacterium]
MSKGVNRQVLEIHDTGSDYFEKAMFFVRPEYSAVNEKKLVSKATELVASEQGIPTTRAVKRKNGLLLFAKLTAAAGVGAAVTALIK